LPVAVLDVDCIVTPDALDVDNVLEISTNQKIRAIDRGKGDVQTVGVTGLPDNFFGKIFVGQFHCFISEL
jgi:hypothetical protein